MSTVITDEPIEILNPTQNGADRIDAERYPIGEAGYYKPYMAKFDDGELWMTVAGPRIYAYDDRPKGFSRHHEDSYLYRSTDGGVSWSGPTLLPDSKEAQLTILSNGTIMLSAHFVQKQKSNPYHYGHTVLYRSDDRGENWTKKHILTEDIPDWKTSVDLTGARDKCDSIDAARDIFEFDDGTFVYQPWGPGRLQEGLKPMGERDSIRVRAILEVGDCTYIAGPWAEIPLVTAANMWDHDIGLMIGGTRNFIELDDGTLLFGTGSREGNERIFVSKDNGKTWDNTRKAEFPDFQIKDPKLYWCNLFQEAFLYKGDYGKIYAIMRVDERYYDPLPGTEYPDEEEKTDQSERMVMYESTDEGKTWVNRKDVGTYGEMYPSVLKLQDGRLLLTYTVRNLNPRKGVRAVFGYEDEDGLHFNYDEDQIIIEAKSPADAYSGGGFGNTVQLDDGTLVTPYSYANPALATTNDITHACLEVVRWKLPS